MAPEKNHQEQKIDYKKPDVYSLGVTMYFMLFGKYVNMSINNALSRKDRGYYVFNYEEYKVPLNLPISICLMELLHGCLRKKPKKRYSIQECQDHRYFT